MEEMNKAKLYTVKELEKMINDYLSYWNDPFGKGDNDIAAANVLPKLALPIALQLLMIMKNIEMTCELIAPAATKST